MSYIGYMENKHYDIISVIIPVYNVSQYIYRCIKSVIEQKHDGLIEIIIIDDCGTDDSMNIVESFLLNHYTNRLFKILRHEYNKGQSAARNLGIRESTGDFIFFLDSDDYLEKETINILYNKWLSTPNAELVSGETQTVKNKKIISTTNLHDLQNTPLKGKEILNGIFKKWHPVCWNKLIRKDFLIKNNLFFKEGLYYEDLFWAFEVALVGTYFETVNNITYNYVIQDKSTTRNLSDKHYYSLIKLINLFYNKIREDKLLFSPNKMKIISIYETIRVLSIDIIFTKFNREKQHEFLKKAQSLNLSTFIHILFNNKISFKTKAKSLPFYIGRFGFKYIILKSKLH